MKYLFLIFISSFVFILNANDSDMDGVENKLDLCKNTIKNAKVDSNGCNLLHDSDKDGITDRFDKCPNSVPNIKVDADGCQPDNDKDGVINEFDECPDTGSGFVVDSVGCPQTEVLKVSFRTKSTKLSKNSFAAIKKYAKFLNTNKGYQAIIYGHTDSKNKSGRNKEISQSRADSVKDALVKAGVDIDRLTAIGVGCKNPIADNATPEGRAKNRRIEVELLQ